MAGFMLTIITLAYFCAYSVHFCVKYCQRAYQVEAMNHCLIQWDNFHFLCLCIDAFITINTYCTKRPKTSIRKDPKITSFLLFISQFSLELRMAPLDQLWLFHVCRQLSLACGGGCSYIPQITQELVKIWVFV